MRCSLSCFWTYSLLSVGNYCKHSTKTDNFILGDRCPVNWMAKTECSAFCSVPTMYTEKEGQPVSSNATGWALLQQESKVGVRPLRYAMQGQDFSVEKRLMPTSTFLLLVSCYYTFSKLEYKSYFWYRR